MNVSDRWLEAILLPRSRLMHTVDLFCEQIMVQPWAGYNLNVFVGKASQCVSHFTTVRWGGKTKHLMHTIQHLYKKIIEISPEVCHSYSKTKVVTFFWSMILYNTYVKQRVTRCTQQLFTYACGLLYTGTKCIHLLPHCSTFTDTIWQCTTGFMS